MTAAEQEVDPTVLCTSFNKHRFFLFSRRWLDHSTSWQLPQTRSCPTLARSLPNQIYREPTDDDDTPRDVFNEKPAKDEQVFEAETGWILSTILNFWMALIIKFWTTLVSISYCFFTIKNLLFCVRNVCTWKECNYTHELWRYSHHSVRWTLSAHSGEF